MTTLPIETRTAAWKPPTLTKSLARTVAKRLDKHWAQTGVKSLKDIRSALGSGIAAGMSMSDRIDHQAAIQKWTASLSKDDLHKVFRMIEEIKNGKGREQYRMTDDALNRLRAASDLLPSERFASEREAEKFEAEAEAANAQAEADRQKADASRLKEGAGGLYGYTKGTQRDVEASVRKAQRRAASIAKVLYAKDERSVDFLKAHAKRANSKTARLILAAMKNIGPRVAADKTARPMSRGAQRLLAQLQANPDSTLPLKEATWLGSRRWDHANVLGNLGLVEWAPGGRGLMLTSKGRGFRAAADKTAAMLPSERHVARVAAEEKVAGGLYGHPTKTARLALVACSDLRAYVGEVAYSLHSRRTAKYGKMTGFLKEHGKTAKCAYSRMILSCYPDAPVSKEAKEKYPWDECIADQEKQYGSKETAEKVCGKIKSQSQGKSAAAKITDREYDALRPGKRIFLGVSGGFMQSGEKEFEVGRTSYSKKYDVYSKTLYPVDEEGNAIKKGRAKWTLFKRPTGVSLGHGGMGTVIKSFRTASVNDQMLKKAFVPDSVDGWLEWSDGTRTAARSISPAEIKKKIDDMEDFLRKLKDYDPFLRGPLHHSYQGVLDQVKDLQKALDEHEGSSKRASRRA